MKVLITAVLHQYRGIFFKEIVSSEIVTDVLEVVDFKNLDQEITDWVRIALECREGHVVVSFSHTILHEGQ